MTDRETIEAMLEKKAINYEVVDEVEYVYGRRPKKTGNIHLSVENIASVDGNDDVVFCFNKDGEFLGVWS